MKKLLILFSLLLLIPLSSSININSFNNSLSEENITFISYSNITRYLPIEVSKFSLATSGSIIVNTPKLFTTEGEIFSLPGEPDYGLSFNSTNYWIRSLQGDNIFYELDLTGSATGNSWNATAVTGSTSKHPFTVYDNTQFQMVGSNNLYKVNYPAGTLIGSFGLDAGNTNEHGATYDGTNYWVTDGSTAIYKYTSGGTSLGISHDITNIPGTNPSITEGDNYLFIIGTNFAITPITRLNKTTILNNISYTPTPSIGIGTQGISYSPDGNLYTLSIFSDDIYKIGYMDNIVNNPFLDVGNNTIEWQQEGNMSFLEDIIIDVNLTEINDYISTCNVISGFCNVPFIFHSDDDGVLQYLNISFSNEGIIQNSVNYTSPVLTKVIDTLSINFTFDSATFPSPIVTFYYNNTAYTPTTSNTGNTRLYSYDITTPEVNTETNISFYWNVALNSTLNVSSNNYNQTVIPLDIDDCSSNTVLALNYTLRDEGLQNILDGTSENTSIEVDLTLSTIGTEDHFLVYHNTFDQDNPAIVCIEPELINDAFYRLDAQARYSSLDRVVEFHNIQNFTLTNATLPQEIQLYDLAIVDSQEFKIVFKDTSFLPVQDALIDITRKYVGEGVFKSVEVPKTDQDGQTIGHLVLSDVIYTFIVKKNGVVLATFDNVLAVCQDLSTGQCTINLIAESTSGNLPDWYTISGLSFSLNYSAITRAFTSIFTVIDGSSHTISLNVTTFNNETLICSNQVTSSSGTLSCAIPTTYNNITVIGTLYDNGHYVASRYVTIDGLDPIDTFGLTGVVLLLFLYLMLPLMFITDKIGVIIAGIMGFVLASMLGIYSGGNLLGLGSIILWFIVAGGVLIYKIAGARN